MSGPGKKKFWLFAASAATALVANGQAVAQEAAETSDEIIVTATKRETALQDVPIAVTPVTAELIQNSGIRDLQDVQSVAPSLQFNVSENESSATARLRGVGTQGSNPGLESAVGIFVDGVYRARNGVALSDLGQVSQIEVLRGPQGTLFGRNTSAGLISVRTAGPDLDEFGGSAEATFGNFGNQRFSGHVNLPIVSEKLGVRVFAAMDERDGFMDVNREGANPNTGAVGAAGSVSNLGAREENNRDMWTVRGQVAWAPSDNFDARFIVDYTERDETCCAAKIYNPTLLNGYPFPFGTGVAQTNVVGAIGGYGPNGVNAVIRGGGAIGQRFAFANRESGQQLEDKGVSAEFNWDLGGVTLTSISAYRDWNYDQGQDADFSQADLWYRPNNGLSGFGFEIFTQELRAAFALGPIDSIVGVFYADETLERRDNLQNGSQFGSYWAAQSGALFGPLVAANNTGIRDVYEQNGESIAIFTHNIWAIDEKTDLTVGLRYTNEEKSVAANFTTAFDAAPLLLAVATGAGQPTQGNCNFTIPTAPNATAINLRSVYCIPTLRTELDGATRRQSREENEFSGVVSVRREFTDNVSGYASVSRGYKGGGFNLDRNFNHIGTPGGTWTTSFAPEFVDAFEIGLKNSLLDGALLLNLATFYNKYENYQLNTFNGVSFQVSSVPEAYSQGVEVDAIWNTPIDGFSYQGGLAYVEAEYGDDSGWVAQSAVPTNPLAPPVNFRLPGSRLTNAPLWTVTSAFTYEKPLFNDALVGLAYLDFRYVSNQITGSDLEPTKREPGYVTVNGRLGLSTQSDRLSLEVWGRNLLDEEYHQIAFNVPLQGNARGAFLGDPRTYGVTLRVEY
jgi:outer membrane receptor protein involved in Fe transport